MNSNKYLFVHKAIRKPYKLENKPWKTDVLTMRDSHKNCSCINLCRMTKVWPQLFSWQNTLLKRPSKTVHCTWLPKACLQTTENNCSFPTSVRKSGWTLLRPISLNCIFFSKLHFLSQASPNTGPGKLKIYWSLKTSNSFKLRIISRYKIDQYIQLSKTNHGTQQQPEKKFFVAK